MGITPEKTKEEIKESFIVSIEEGEKFRKKYDSIKNTKNVVYYGEKIERNIQFLKNQYECSSKGAEKILYDLLFTRKVHVELFGMAKEDELTKLPNRRSFNEQSEIAVNNAKENKYGIGMIMFDIDDFKKINDNYGHPVGDTALKEISKIIKESFRKEDIIGRYGGEEFCVLITFKGDKNEKQIKEETKRKAETIRLNIEEHFKENLIETENISKDKANNIVGTISVGYTSSKFNENSNISASTLIKRADTASYLSKKTGKNKTNAYLENETEKRVNELLAQEKEIKNESEIIENAAYNLTPEKVKEFKAELDQKINKLPQKEQGIFEEVRGLSQEAKDLLIKELNYASA